ncbi:DUF317 domain-containing protein [Streptomyces sp. NPDC058603]|uniref:DUF317 domain-containing protein n=1 Tax=Streptomyces sp. NPDC058603 TaxID=3346551 RepID=UPI003668E0D5
MLLWTSLVPEPNDPRKAKWITAAHRPSGQEAWQITFDATTPVELLHDIHADLLDLYLEDRHSDQDRLYGDETAPYEAYAPLLTRGWSHDVKTDGTQTFLAPEGLGGVRHRYAPGFLHGLAWRAWGGCLSEPHWQARFSSGTPTTLVAAFTASLISTEPVRRTAKDVPFYTRHHLNISTATAKQPPGYSPAAPPPAGPRPGRTR